MAKKKIKKEVVKQTTATLGAQNIGYQGQVKITAMRGNTPLSTKIYRNSGLPNLFKFLGMSLAGTYNESLKPSCIKLFHCTQQTPSAFNWDAEASWSASHASTGLIPFDATPVLQKVANVTSPTSSQYHYEVTYHFRIPQAYITTTSIQFAAIYANGNTSEKDACAYYLFKKAEGDEWDSFEVPAGSTDYSLVVEWTMSVMNKEN